MLTAWFTTPVTVTPYEGESAYGATYGAEQTVMMRVNDGRKLVRNSAGDEVVSETTLYGPLEAAAAFAPESVVTVDGRPSRVITIARRRGRVSNVLDHVEVTVA